MKTFEYTSSNGNTYKLVKTYLKFGNKESQEQYNEGVTKYNNTIDEIRIKLKEALKEDGE